MKYPIKLVFDIAMELGAYKPFFRGQHIVVVGITRACRIKEPDFAFTHGFSIYGNWEKRKVKAAEMDIMALAWSPESCQNIWY
jgi:hypothetical protein